MLAATVTACSAHREETAGAATEEAAAAPKEADALRDGTYVPGSFAAEGGSGKVKITCPEVTVQDKNATALICFSSPHYEWVKADGRQYEPENASEEGRTTSLFRIPVQLDEDMEITGLTTAMSEPHEVRYTIRVSLEQGASAEDADAGQDETEAESAAAAQVTPESPAEPPVIEGLTLTKEKELHYAEAFDIYTYQSAEGAQYRLIDVHGSGRYLLFSEGAESAPEDLPEDITVLGRTPDTIYVAATSSMALFDAAGSLDRVKLTGTDASGWYIDGPKKALESGKMVYAGKYSAPDYELLTSSDCDLAVESMMILHAPEVKEKIEELGIPVFIDTSSTESHPLGRTEWVRLYGVLTGQEERADAFFAAQEVAFEKTKQYEDTGLTVAFFSVSSSGNVIVRAADDYIPKMIGLAGGRYALEGLSGKTGTSASVRLTMEEFYNQASDADYLVYNATIEEPAADVAQLIEKEPLLTDFKAVKENHVWQVERNLYQSPDIAVQLIGDLHGMLTGEDPEKMVFLDPLK